MSNQSAFGVRVVCAAALPLIFFTAAMPARAGTASGTIAVSLNVTSACVVNGASSVTSTFGNAGTLAFADQPGLFGNVDAQVQTSGGGALSVLCSPGASPSLTLGSGQHDNSGQRFMTAGSSSIAYRLFSDAARTQEIAVGGSIPLGSATSSPISVPLYGRVNSGGSVIAAGSYTDTVAVTLTW